MTGPFKSRIELPNLGGKETSGKRPTANISNTVGLVSTVADRRAMIMKG